MTGVQTCALPIYGRVDHRSYARQGLDKEPTIHLGPHAAEMDRNGIETDLAAMNDLVRARNELAATVTESGGVLDARIAFEQRKFEGWAERKRTALAAETTAREHAFLDEASKRSQAIEREHAPQKAKLSETQATIDARLASRGFRKVVRDLFGRTKRDRQALAIIKAQRAELQRAVISQKAKVQETLRAERAAQKAEQAKEAALLERGINRARARREGQNWEGQAKAFQSRRAEQEMPPAPPKHRKAAQTPPSLPKVDPKAKRADKAVARRQKQIEALAKRLEASQGLKAPTPQEPGPSRDFTQARKNERDR